MAKQFGLLHRRWVGERATETLSSEDLLVRGLQGAKGTGWGGVQSLLTASRRTNPDAVASSTGISEGICFARSKKRATARVSVNPGTKCNTSNLYYLS